MTWLNRRDCSDEAERIHSKISGISHLRESDRNSPYAWRQSRRDRAEDTDPLREQGVPFKKTSCASLCELCVNEAEHRNQLAVAEERSQG
jgi:hypothetical protein